MEYVILKDEETSEIEKIRRFLKDGIAEQFCGDHWETDASLYSLQFDGFLEEINQTEVEKLTALQYQSEKIAV